MTPDGTATIDQARSVGSSVPTGKTTMFNVVSRIYQPTEGRVLFRVMIC
jgi:ABC-type branched-subunit amino acid transport system ATPase component